MVIVKRIGFWALVTVIVAQAVFPFYYAILTSFESGQAIFDVNYLPKVIDFVNYRKAFENGVFGRQILNSVFVAAVVVALARACREGESTDREHRAADEQASSKRTLHFLLPSGGRKEEVDGAVHNVVPRSVLLFPRPYMQTHVAPIARAYRSCFGRRAP